MKYGAQDELVLSIFSTSRGLAYTYFEAPLSPIDWGVKRIRQRDKNSRSLAIVERLCDGLRPDTIVVEECVLSRSRRSRRVRRLYALIVLFAETKGINLAFYSRSTVKKTFRESGAITREQIAQVIASTVDAFAHRRPRRQRRGQVDDTRLALFEAAALALTHFAFVPSSAEPP